MAHHAPPGKSPETLATVAVLLIVAIIAALWVPIYARLTPKLGPFPFFYWYQLIWVPLAAVLCWICYLLLRKKPAPEAPFRAGQGCAPVNHLNAVTFAVLLASFLIVTFIGFASARWRPAEDPMQLSEWGLGGRGFGTFVSWFLLGGDIYTAYTFIAVPALVYATGARGSTRCRSRSWSSRSCSSSGRGCGRSPGRDGYVTPGEFVRGRHGSQGLGLAVR